MDWISRLKGSLEKSHADAPVVNGGDPAAEDTRVSSVLLCLGQQKGNWEIILTKRTQYVQTHKGQVSFPGGIQEAHDATLLDTALRETEEEIGIRKGDLQVLGALPPVDTIGKVRIYPWVAHLPLPYPFRLSFDEVDRLLFLPVNDLLINGIVPVKVRVDSYDVKSEGIYCEGELVWGATAKILKDFRQKAVDFAPLSASTETA